MFCMKETEIFQPLVHSPSLIAGARSSWSQEPGTQSEAPPWVWEPRGLKPGAMKSIWGSHRGARDLNGEALSFPGHAFSRKLDLEAEPGPEPRHCDRGISSSVNRWTKHLPLKWVHSKWSRKYPAKCRNLVLLQLHISALTRHFRSSPFIVFCFKPKGTQAIIYNINETIVLVPVHLLRELFFFLLIQETYNPRWTVKD